MTGLLEIRAGTTALAHIREHGLSPSDIRVVTGASGAAKWLGIYGLYRAIFSQWLRDLSHPVFLYGTSIGAWTLSAGAQADPGRAYDRLKSAYIGQVYRGRITPEKITRESLGILDRVFGPDQVSGILAHPFLRLSFSAVRCRGPMAGTSAAAMAAGMLAAFGLNLVSRKTQSVFFRRTLFHCAGEQGQVPFCFDGSKTERVALNHGNFRQALLASGSIPVIMAGVRDILGAGEGMYRDGGVLDYHPVVAMKREEPGFIFYPHFYPRITPGWFDKKLPWRAASGKVLDRTILVSPSPQFIRNLPCGRIPDRKDFIRFQGRDAERFQLWNRAAGMSLDLGQAFLSAVESGRIRQLVREL
jgi:hypothetical protein